MPRRMVLRSCRNSVPSLSLNFAQWMLASSPHKVSAPAAGLSLMAMSSLMISQFSMPMANIMTYLFSLAITPMRAQVSLSATLPQRKVTKAAQRLVTESLPMLLSRLILSPKKMAASSHATSCAMLLSAGRHGTGHVSRLRRVSQRCSCITSTSIPTILKALPTSERALIMVRT